ncbi:MAG: nitrogenase component 1 [Eubacteriaceae bacterium]|jgi:nitrogenase molybdenum-cofactor synthesis protein NifE|nr:nitrogenase component 1 [Eubacteriaceae bacterium]
MAREAFYITAEKLAELGPDKVPPQMISGEHLIYSSPATLSYNSPGAQGFGVKRAGLVIPESVMLLVSPACCGRNTTILADEGGYSDRMFFLQMDETDLITGAHLTNIPQAVMEICDVCAERPKVVVICITCVDALMGTDLTRVCRRAEEAAGVKVVPSYMYALTREGKNPPMVAIRETIYSLLSPLEKRNDMVNLIGNFAPLEDDTDLYEFLRQIGIRKANEVSRCSTLDEFREMGAANFNLILNPEARKAAVMMEKTLGMPFAELTRVYELGRIRKQYELFGAALGAAFDLDEYYGRAEAAGAMLQKKCGGASFAIGQVVNGNPVEMALALTKLGLDVKEVFANIGAEDFPYIRELAERAPEMKLYSTLSPTMMNYSCGGEVDISLGIDASFYYPHSVNIRWNSEIQPFGYMGFVHFAEAVERGIG